MRHVFVPEQRIFLLLDPSGHRPEPLYQMPPIGLFVSQLVAVSLGIARGALDELIELAQTKVPTLSQDVLADKPVAQIDLARAEASLAAARAFLYETVSGGAQVATVWRKRRAYPPAFARPVAEFFDTVLAGRRRSNAR